MRLHCCCLLAFVASLILSDTQAFSRLFCCSRPSARRLAIPPSRTNVETERDFQPIFTTFQRKLVFGGAFLAENLVSYFGPGSDGTIFPQSDLDLITEQLLSPEVIQSPPQGSGIGIFSYLLFNSFIYLPIVWAALLLPENCACQDDNNDSGNQILPAWPCLVSSAAFGGIGLYPYLALRESKNEDNAKLKRSDLPFFLSLFEGTTGRVGLVLINLWLLVVFLTPFVSGHSHIWEECTGFWQLIGGSMLTEVSGGGGAESPASPFARTTALDVCFLGLALVDPISDDAKRRGVLDQDATTAKAIRQLLFPYLIPVFGSLFWILARPGLEQHGERD